MCVRFAPSPTGPLHIGGVRTALFNWLFARHHQGKFILRIEDTDRSRYVPGAEQHIIESLRWVGLTWDEGPIRQSTRTELYRRYAHELVQRGYAYYAFDTEEELERMRQDLRAAGVPNPQYNVYTRQYMRNSLTLPEEEVQRRLASGEPYVIRLYVPADREIRFHDQIRGWIRFQSRELDDKILLKSDGFPTYHLANVVDDHLMGVTHVIRGEEWIPSTPIHLLIYEGMGWTPPEFAHLPLILRPDGKGKLSKREALQLGIPIYVIQWKDPHTGEEMPGFRELGFLPEAVLNILALLGWHPPDAQREIFTLQEMIQTFSLERIGASGARLNYEKALWINQQYLQRLSEEAFRQKVAPFLEAVGVPPDAFHLELANLYRTRAHTLREIADEVRAIREWTPVRSIQSGEVSALESVTLNACEQDALQAFLRWWRAHTGEATPDVLTQKIREIARERELKPGQLMLKIRWAISGKRQGPPLGALLHLMKDKAIERIAKLIEQT